MQDATFALLAAGVEPDRVAVEVFVSPETRAGTAVPPPMPGPFHVSFTASEAEATWYESGGTLLDLADACGLMLPASCRSGACGTCAQRLVTGETAYTTEPVLPPRAPVVLLCCAVPTSDVFIQA
jgi:ferredoxin